MKPPGLLFGIAELAGAPRRSGAGRRRESGMSKSRHKGCFRRPTSGAHRTSCLAVDPRFLAARMQPNPIWAGGPVPRVQRVGGGGRSSAMIAEAGCSSVVKLALRSELRLPIRPSVQIRIAVGQVRIFRSVRSRRLDGSKNARSFHFIGVWTLGRIGRVRMVRRGVLTRKIGGPCLPRKQHGCTPWRL